MTRADEIAAGIARNLAFWAKGEDPDKRQAEDLAALNAEALVCERFPGHARQDQTMSARTAARLLSNVASPAVRKYRETLAEMPPRPAEEVTPAILEQRAISEKLNRSYKAQADAARLAHVRQAEAEFTEDAQDGTGMGLSPVQWEKQRKNAGVKRSQSKALAKRLENLQIPAYRNDAYSLWEYFIHSNTFRRLESFRRICLLPEVAALVRAPKLAALEYFLQEHPFCRFWTFTTGERCLVDDLTERIKTGNRKLRALNYELKKRWGITFVLRAWEFGDLEETNAADRPEGGAITRDDQGRPLFHPHMHVVLYRPAGFLASEKWDEAIEFVWGFWGHHWDAGEIIRDARECCKYVSKPGDVLELPDDTLAKLFAVTYRQKLIQPLGQLAEDIRAREGDPDTGVNRKVLRRCRDKRTGKMRWAERLDHNKTSFETEADRAARMNLQDAQEFAGELHAAIHAEAPSAPGELDGTAPRFRDPAMTDFCRVVARIAPAAGPTPLKEPRVLVMGTRFDLRQIRGHPLVQKLWAETVQEWEAGRAISVHTGTPSVLPDRAAAILERPPPEAEPEFAPYRGEFATVDAAQWL